MHADSSPYSSSVRTQPPASDERGTTGSHRHRHTTSINSATSSALSLKASPSSSMNPPPSSTQQLPPHPPAHAHSLSSPSIGAVEYKTMTEEEFFITTLRDGNDLVRAISSATYRDGLASSTCRSGGGGGGLGPETGGPITPSSLEHDGDLSLVVSTDKKRPSPTTTATRLLRGHRTVSSTGSGGAQESSSLHRAPPGRSHGRNVSNTSSETALSDGGRCGGAALVAKNGSNGSPVLALMSSNGTNTGALTEINSRPGDIQMISNSSQKGRERAATLSTQGPSTSSATKVASTVNPGGKPTGSSSNVNMASGSPPPLGSCPTATYQEEEENNGGAPARRFRTVFRPLSYDDNAGHTVAVSDDAGSPVPQPLATSRGSPRFVGAREDALPLSLEVGAGTGSVVSDLSLSQPPQCLIPYSPRDVVFCSGMRGSTSMGRLLPTAPPHFSDSPSSATFVSPTEFTVAASPAGGANSHHQSVGNGTFFTSGGSGSLIRPVGAGSNSSGTGTPFALQTRRLNGGDAASSSGPVNASTSLNPANGGGGNGANAPVLSSRGRQRETSGGASSSGSHSTPPVGPSNNISNNSSIANTSSLGATRRRTNNGEETGPPLSPSSITATIVSTVTDSCNSSCDASMSWLQAVADRSMEVVLEGVGHLLGFLSTLTLFGVATMLLVVLLLIAGYSMRQVRVRALEMVARYEDAHMTVLQRSFGQAVSHTVKMATLGPQNDDGEEEAGAAVTVQSLHEMTALVFAGIGGGLRASFAAIHPPVATSAARSDPLSAQRLACFLCLRQSQLSGDETSLPSEEEADAGLSSLVSNNPTPIAAGTSKTLPTKELAIKKPVSAEGCVMCHAGAVRRCGRLLASYTDSTGTARSRTFSSRSSSNPDRNSFKKSQDFHHIVDTHAIDRTKKDETKMAEKDGSDSGSVGPQTTDWALFAAFARCAFQEEHRRETEASLLDQLEEFTGSSLALQDARPTEAAGKQQGWYGKHQAPAFSTSHSTPPVAAEGERFVQSMLVQASTARQRAQRSVERWAAARAKAMEDLRRRKRNDDDEEDRARQQTVLASIRQARLQEELHEVTDGIRADKLIDGDAGNWESNASCGQRNESETTVPQRASTTPRAKGGHTPTPAVTKTSLLTTLREKPSAVVPNASAAQTPPPTRSTISRGDAPNMTLTALLNHVWHRARRLMESLFELRIAVAFLLLIGVVFLRK